MDRRDLDKLGRLSPFELKNSLIELAASHAERVMLNAGRGNPNFLATAPRHAFFLLGVFAMQEAERYASDLPEGVGGLPSAKGIAARFKDFLASRQPEPGGVLLADAMAYADAALGFAADAFVHELVEGVLGCNYPEPVRMLRHAEEIVRRYLLQEMGGPGSPIGVDLCAVEGATAGVTYVFNALRENRLIAPGDTVAIGTPIFSPYLEIPLLNDYRLTEMTIAADPDIGWQYPESEIAKLSDPRVKALLLVNPGNPTSVKIDRTGLARVAEMVARRPDLIILTDDVYATFADGFTSVFALCPRNTILVYSFSKYFGTTGWRLGVVAMAQDNVIDAAIRALPERDGQELDTRYAALVAEPRRLKFIDRLIADSRAIAFNHTAGLSTPQQVQMALFALFALMDERGDYKRAMKQLIRGRHRALYEALGIDAAEDPNGVCYYALLDLERLGAQRYGRGFVDWLLAAKNPLEILFRLADEAGIVLLPGKGFGMPHPSARASLANLNGLDYARMGRIIRTMMEDYVSEYQNTLATSP
ncbi:MAG TPA: bifunctional aspartate transaminase/aspartate 4-decarboxylase [Stellaceae bacterium]|nr:bifunctional aspartate transaminase/aspartate 4-decarboxylase [Stellaceae bacterium]